MNSHPMSIKKAEEYMSVFISHSPKGGLLSFFDEESTSAYESQLCVVLDEGLIEGLIISE